MTKRGVLYCLLFGALCSLAWQVGRISSKVAAIDKELSGMSKFANDRSCELSEVMNDVIAIKNKLAKKGGEEVGEVYLPRINSPRHVSHSYLPANTMIYQTYDIYPQQPVAVPVDLPQAEEWAIQEERKRQIRDQLERVIRWSTKEEKDKP